LIVKDEMSTEVPQICQYERWGAGVEYHFQEIQ